MGWLHHRTIDDFKLIDILNEINCKCVVKLNISFLNELLFYNSQLFSFVFEDRLVS